MLLGILELSALLSFSFLKRYMKAIFRLSSSYFSACFCPEIALDFWCLLLLKQTHPSLQLSMKLFFHRMDVGHLSLFTMVSLMIHGLEIVCASQEGWVFIPYLYHLNVDWKLKYHPLSCFMNALSRDLSVAIDCALSGQPISTLQNPRLLFPFPKKKKSFMHFYLKVSFF